MKSLILLVATFLLLIPPVFAVPVYSNFDFRYANTTGDWISVTLVGLYDEDVPGVIDFSNSGGYFRAHSQTAGFGYNLDSANGGELLYSGTRIIAFSFFGIGIPSGSGDHYFASGNLNRADATWEPTGPRPTENVTVIGSLRMNGAGLSLSVPDTGSTAFFLGAGLLGLAVVGRRMGRKKA